MDTILVVNAGSSSVKFQVFAVDSDGRLLRQIKGQMDGIGSRPRLWLKPCRRRAGVRRLHRELAAQIREGGRLQSKDRDMLSGVLDFPAEH
jgi:acetate kinase